MKQKVSPVVKPGKLLLLMSSTTIVLIDASAGSKERYAKAHLTRALYVDLDKQLANIKPDPSNGGRHPLPDFEQFSKVLKQLGISPQSHVVIYDDKNCSNAAARFWWMLKSIGHNKVQVLDGGYDAAINAGFQISSEVETPLISDTYEIDKWLFPLAEIGEVEKAAEDNNFIVIDVRSKERFNGETETIDLIAGHIPGAINIPFTGNLNTEGFYLPPAELRDKYLKVLGNKKPENIIVHCGSGVTACHTLLAMTYAGLEIPKLYVGSWSEWSRSNKSVATSKKINNI